MFKVPKLNAPVYKNHVLDAKVKKMEEDSEKRKKNKAAKA